MSVQLTLNSWAKQAGLGKLLYRLYYGPRSYAEKVLQRGIVAYVTDQYNKSQMESMVHQFEPCTERSGEPYEVHFLTGERFWQQTSFCFYSLWHQTSLNLQLVIYDDGSLTDLSKTSIQRIFPNVKIISATQIRSALDTFLPEEKFPALRARRLEYPHLRKLTDIHVGGQGWKLVLDSDMLFFHPPVELLNWLQSPQKPTYMVDVETSYGYTSRLMSDLAGVSIPEKINVGITGLCSHQLDWDELESWCKIMIEREGTHYCQEQAMIAMLMARQPCDIMPADTYIVMPGKEDVVKPIAKLHHYVADSKPWYFRYGWRKAMELSLPS